MKGRWRLGAAAAVAVGLACGAPPSADLTALLPDPSRLAGWRVVEGPVEHGPDTLYDYLDGGAERYLGLGFTKLLHLRYQLGGDPLACVTIDLFDMGGSSGAFGIFRSVLPTDATPEAWCAESYRSGIVAAAWKGSLYVHGEADDARAELAATLGMLMEHICERAPGAAGRPAFLDPLPAEGLMPQSERWVASDLLGHAFLPGGVTASYRLEGRDALLFYSELGSEGAAAEAMGRLRAHWAQRTAVDEFRSPGRGGFRYSDGELGSGSAASAGRFVAGVQCDLPDLPVEAQQRLLAALTDALAAAR